MENDDDKDGDIVDEVITVVLEEGVGDIVGVGGGAFPENFINSAIAPIKNSKATPTKIQAVINSILVRLCVTNMDFSFSGTYL